jgi:AraC-like DNA-binding protein
VINRKTGMNFAEFVNVYRVEKAKALLQDPEYLKYKIASIAFDCGFNTLSTFNLAF